MDRLVEHMGPERGARWMRKAYPWYVERLGLADKAQVRALQDGLQRTDGLQVAHEYGTVVPCVRG